MVQNAVVRDRRVLSVVAGVLALLALGQSAFSQVKVVAYNCYHRPTSSSDPNWQTVLSNIGSETYGGISKRPDVLALTELDYLGATGSRIQSICNNLWGGQGANYQRVEVDTNAYEDYAFVYDASAVELLDWMPVEIGTRDALRGHFRPVGYTATGSDFYVYNVHLKAYAGFEGQRAGEVSAMLYRTEGAADDLPADSNIMFVGDFNFVSGPTGEPGYQYLLAAGDSQCVDPEYGNWSGRYATYSSTNLYSRIDFQLITTELNDAEGLDLIPGTYRAHGNNNGSTSGYTAVRNASDHLGVVADYQLPAVMDVSVQQDHAVVIKGASSNIDITVTNTADVVAVHGADELDYGISGTGVVAGSASGSDAALGAGSSHSIGLDTSTAGQRSGQLIVDSSSPGVQSGQFQQAVSLTVLDHSEASFHDVLDENQLVIDLGAFAPDQGVVNASTFELHNLMASSWTAALDIDAVFSSGDADALFTDLTAGATIQPGGFLTESIFVNAGLGQGSLSSSWTVGVSDEDLPGATAGQSLLLILSAYVAANGDLDLDGDVDLTDLSILASNWNSGAGQLSFTQGDIDDDDDVDLTDLSLLAANWGYVAGMTIVPEPTTAALMILAAAGMVRRRGCKV